MRGYQTLSKGESAHSASPPDPLVDLRAWFAYFQRSSDGMTEEEVFKALTMTPQINNIFSEDGIRYTLRCLWSVMLFDQSKIGITEFCMPGGLGRALVTQLPYLAQSRGTLAINVEANMFELQKRVEHIMMRLPWVTRPNAYAALMLAAGNPDAAIGNLISSSNGAAFGYPHPYWREGGNLAVPHLPSPAAIQKFLCGYCGLELGIEMDMIPPHAMDSAASCPRCGGINQIHFTRDVSLSGNSSTLATEGKKEVPALPIRDASRTDVPLPSPRDLVMQHMSMMSDIGPIYRPSLNLIRQPAPLSVFTRPPLVNRKRKALLIGVNYAHQPCELRESLVNVENMFRLLVHTFNWMPADITIFAESRHPDIPESVASDIPTRANILAAMKALVSDCNPGDAFFFFFCGHGSHVDDPSGIHERGVNETIHPVDFQEAGVIKDDELSSVLVKTLPEGVRLTAVIDCGFSGAGLDLPFAWTTRSRKFIEETNPYHSLADVQLFSCLEDAEMSVDDKVEGMISAAFCEILRNHSSPTYVELLVSLQTMLSRRRKHKQRVQLTSSQAFDIDRSFSLHSAIKNSNVTIGRTVRKKIVIRKKKTPKERSSSPSVGEKRQRLSSEAEGQGVEPFASCEVQKIL